MGRPELVKALIGACVNYDQLPYQMGTPDYDRLRTGLVDGIGVLHALDEHAAEAFVTRFFDLDDNESYETLGFQEDLMRYIRTRIESANTEFKTDVEAIAARIALEDVWQWMRKRLERV